jgi:hypothetical protein
MIEFVPFGKIPRLKRTITITEKIDGTNAQIVIVPAGTYPEAEIMEARVAMVFDKNQNCFDIFAGSRNRYIWEGNDNFGFAKWVKANANELVRLGPGTHYGEWWGAGIQRAYGQVDHKFSLFNVGRWVQDENDPGMPNDPCDDKQCYAPVCCGVVPTLYVGTHSDDAIEAALAHLRSTGSMAAPGYQRPEGIVVFHHASRTYYKVTLEKDDKPKGSTE